VLFVFARAAQGPRAPLAIQRLSAASLPTSVLLDQSMGMIEGMNLGAFPEVVVGARVSASGNATPQAGDLEGLTDPVAVSVGRARVVIDRILP
jgi:cytochrome c-type biogenesis protein CcmH